MYFETVRINDMDKYIRKGNVILIDLRSKEDFAASHLNSAINLCHDELMKQKAMLRSYDRIFLYCERGNQSLQAARDLAKEGFYVVNLSGGIKAYRGLLVK